MKLLRYIWDSLGRSSVAMLLVGCVSLANGLPGFAGESNIITLKGAIDIALQNNPDYKKMINQVDLGRVNVSQKKSNFLPELGLSAQTSQSFASTTNYETDDYKDTNNRNASLTASFNVTLYQGGYHTAALRQSRHELEALNQNLDRYQQFIIFETIQRYIQVVLSQALIEADRQNLEAQRLQLDRIEAFYKAGRRPIADLYQQQAEISRYEYLLLTAERNYKVSKFQLSQIIGEDPGRDFTVRDPGVDQLIPRLLDVDNRTLTAEALELRPDRKSQSGQIDAATEQLTISRSTYRPKISLFANAGTNYSSANERVGFSDQFFNHNLNGAIGLSISLPLFDRNVTRNNMATAKISLKNEEADMQKLEQQIGVEIRQAIQDYMTARQKVIVARTQQTYAKSALESVQERYDVNAATMAELIQARSQHYQSRYDLLDAKFGLFVSGIALHYYQGNTEQMMSLIITK